MYYSTRQLTSCNMRKLANRVSAIPFIAFLTIEFRLVVQLWVCLGCCHVAGQKCVVPDSEVLSPRGQCYSGIVVI